MSYSQAAGEHLKHLVFSGERTIACLVLASVVRHLGPRDRFPGWSSETRQKNRHLMVYNTRLLILPRVRVQHPASHLLAQCTRRVSRDCQAPYHHPVYWVETFVDRERFQGTCYRAANWICPGQTTGRGKWDHAYKPNRSLLPEEEMDRIFPLYPSHCERCGNSLDPVRQSSPALRHQVFELPRMASIKTEYRAHELCRSRGHKTRADFPQEVSMSQFGPRLHAAVAYLSSVHRGTCGGNTVELSRPCHSGASRNPDFMWFSGPRLARG